MPHRYFHNILQLLLEYIYKIRPPDDITSKASKAHLCIKGVKVLCLVVFLQDSGQIIKLGAAKRRPRSSNGREESSRERSRRSRLERRNHGGWKLSLLQKRCGGGGGGGGAMGEAACTPLGFVAVLGVKLDFVQTVSQWEQQDWAEVCLCLRLSHRWGGWGFFFFYEKQMSPDRFFFFDARSSANSSERKSDYIPIPSQRGCIENKYTVWWREMGFLPELAFNCVYLTVVSAGVALMGAVKGRW